MGFLNCIWSIWLRTLSRLCSSVLIGESFGLGGSYSTGLKQIAFFDESHRFLKHGNKQPPTELLALWRCTWLSLGFPLAT